MAKNEIIPIFVQTIKKTLENFSFVSEMIEERDYKYWEKKLNEAPNINSYLLDANRPYNFLTSIGILSTEDVADNLKIFSNHCLSIFTKLNRWLQEFPELKTTSSFKNKIKNLEGYNFLATLSELSIASYLKSKGFLIEFETKFSLQQSDKKRDVDISITDKNHNTTHIEVYMPHNKTVESGFYDPKETDPYFVYKTDKKLFDKFGSDGLKGLSGKVLLGINISFFDDQMIQRSLPLSIDNELFKNIRLPNGVDGLLCFIDAFGDPNSFKFDRLVLRN